MGNANVATKMYMSDNKRFADVFNYFLYGGRQIIKPENLTEKDTTEFVGILLEEEVFTKEKYGL